MIWSIIQYWQGKDVIKSVVPDSEQTNIEKFLLSWCQQQTRGFEEILQSNLNVFYFPNFRYKGVEINDFTRSWQDGLAFNALIHKFRPELFDYDEILQNASSRNLEHAFSVAKNVFKIDRYLDVEGWNIKNESFIFIMFIFQIFFLTIPIKNLF